MDHHLLFITTKGPGRLPGAFLLPAMLGCYRQAVEASQRKYARLGDDLGGHCVFIGTLRWKAPNIACNAFYIVWYTVWGKARKRKEGAILPAWCDCSTNMPHGPACYRLDRGACFVCAQYQIFCIAQCSGRGVVQLDGAHGW